MISTQRPRSPLASTLSPCLVLRHLLLVGFLAAGLVGFDATGAQAEQGTYVGTHSAGAAGDVDERTEQDAPEVLTEGVDDAAHAGEAAPNQSRDGTCDPGEFCYYYNSNAAGSVSDFGGPLRSLQNYGTSLPTCYVFKGSGNGKGRCIKNDAASVWNRTDRIVRVYFNSGYAGPSQDIGAGFRGNLSAKVKNNNASHKLLSTPPPSGDPYPEPRDNPHPPATSTPGKPTARTQHVDAEIARRTGERDCSAGGSRSNRSDHNTGNALDCTISDAIGTRPDAAQREQGWQLAKWLRKYAARLDVQYVIWDGKIWNRARDDEGWRTHSAADEGVTAGHYDHVHVSIRNPDND